MCQISSLMAATEGPAAQFSSFANFEERKKKSNLLMSFPKIVHQKGSFGQIRKNSLFRFCRPILDIFGLTLLINSRLVTGMFLNILLSDAKAMPLLISNGNLFLHFVFTIFSLILI